LERLAIGPGGPSSGLSWRDLRDLLWPGHMMIFVRRRRTALILSRVRQMAITFSILTSAWIPMDLLFFDAPLRWTMAGMRILASMAFFWIYASVKDDDGYLAPVIQRGLGKLLSVPTLFFVVSYMLVSSEPSGGALQQAVATGYIFLPFVMVAGLSVFPLTALEGVLYSAPLVVAYAATCFLVSGPLSAGTVWGGLWLLILLTLVSTLAGMSQLQFMIQLVNQASHDGLTRTFNRPIGEEMINQHFVAALRMDAPFALAFVDLDHFKQVNDRFGHEAGDATLRTASQVLGKGLRRGDFLIRWGGEEFVAVMPNTDKQGANIAITRILHGGLGIHPGGGVVTASIGIAERKTDGLDSWQQLVERADQRMYTAKQNGRSRVVSEG
jgi:diguanylate cyclase (GGDEF)-like protein